jgi:hypothetical protein
MYLFGVLFIRNFVLVFIFTLLLLSLDFYYLKNIAGRRLVGLRWWNEVNTSTGDSHWVFESRESGAGTGLGAEQNKTDKRFFWLAIYIAPALWVGLAVLAIVRLQKVIWLVTVGKSYPMFYRGVEGERREVLETGLLTEIYSDCADSDDNEHGGVLEVR